VIEENGAPGGFPLEGERLSLGVAARLSRYLQVLTQARKMGRETISSQELSEYTHINPTQIRRDLSGFGKFGKRGVGYNVDSLVSEIRKILRTAGQHNIALFGAGHLGQAIASSAIFADHGFQVVAVFDVDEGKIGTEIGDVIVRPLDDDLARVVADGPLDEIRGRSQKVRYVVLVDEQKTLVGGPAKKAPTAQEVQAALAELPKVGAVTELPTDDKAHRFQLSSASTTDMPDSASASSSSASTSSRYSSSPS